MMMFGSRNRLGGPSSMQCFQSTHNLYCSQRWTSRPYSAKLTAHPDNQTIGSKDDVPAFVDDHVAPATARGLFSPYLLDEICGLCSRGIDQASEVLWLQNALKTIIMLIAVRRALQSKMKQPGEQPGVARSSQENSQEQPGTARRATKSSPHPYFTTSQVGNSVLEPSW